MKMETEITVLVKVDYNTLKKELEKSGFQLALKTPKTDSG